MLKYGLLYESLRNPWEFAETQVYVLHPDFCACRKMIDFVRGDEISFWKMLMSVSRTGCGI
jgi:hypothetical protein